MDLAWMSIILNQTDNETGLIHNKSAASPWLLSKLPLVNVSQIKELVEKGLILQTKEPLEELLLAVIGLLGSNAGVYQILDYQFSQNAALYGTDSNPGKITSLSLKGMKRLQDKGKKRTTHFQVQSGHLSRQA